MGAAIAADVPPRPRVRRLSTWIAAAVLAVIAYFVFEGLVAIGAFPAPGADARLRTLGRLSVATTPPPGGVVIGRQDYHGKSGNFPQTPDIEIIYAVPASVDSVVAYYRNLPGYRFSGGVLDPQEGTHLGNNAYPGMGNAQPGINAPNVDLRITPWRPLQMLTYRSISLLPSPAGTNCYVEVLIS